MKKRITYMLSLLLALTLLVACGGESAEESETTSEVVSEEAEQSQETTEKAESGEVTTLEMLVPGYESGYMKDQLDSIIAEYEQDNSGVKIEVVSAGWDELNSKIVQLYQAGDAPDIMLIGSKSIRQFSELGVMEDLTPYLTEDYIAERDPNVFDTGKNGETQYAIPFGLSTRALYYRSDLIETPPTNWDELLEIALKVNEEHGIYGFSIPTDITHGTPELLNFIYQNEGRMVDENGDYTLNSDENVEALEYLSKFKDIIPDPVGTKRSDQTDIFMNGDLAMFINLPVKEKLDSTADQYPYGVVMLPVGKVPACTLVTDSFAISAISENKDVAWDFIEFMTTGERQVELTYDGWVPVLKAQYEDPKYATDFMKPFVDILPHGVPEPQTPNYDQFNEALLIAAQKVLTGQAEAKDALDLAQQELLK